MTEALQILPNGRRALGAPCSPGLSLAIGRALGTVVVTLHGTVDDAGAAVLCSVLRDLIDEQGNLDVVVDLRRVMITDPAGHAVLRQASDWAERHGGRLTLYQRNAGRRWRGGEARNGERGAQPAVPESDSSGRRWGTAGCPPPEDDPMRLTAMASNISHMEATRATPA